MPGAQVMMNFDPPQTTNPHLYTISSNNAIVDGQGFSFGYGREGQQDAGYYFDGNRDTRIDIKTIPDWKGFSVSLWTYPNISKTYQTIMSKGDGRRIYTDTNDGKTKINYFGNDYIIGNYTEKNRDQIGVTLDNEGILTTYLDGIPTNSYAVSPEIAQ